MLFVGIDLGTSAVKLLLMNEKGEIQKIANREYPLYFPRPGWSEQNPTDWYDKTIDGLKELLSECDKSRVAGISFGGQMHGLVVLDEKDEVIRPAILWNDGRTEKQVEYLNQQIGKDKISQYTANIAFAGFTAPKILWMREEEPEQFERIHKIMLPKDYLAYRLSGAFVTDVSDASGMLLMDVKNRCWSGEMLSLCGITEEQLPELHESYDVVGTLLPKVAEELGLSTDVKVIAEQETMRQQLWEQEPWERAPAIFPLEPQGPCLSPTTCLGWTLTMLSTPSPMQTVIIILWDVCSLQPAAISGGWMRFCGILIMPVCRKT